MVKWEVSIPAVRGVSASVLSMVVLTLIIQMTLMILYIRLRVFTICFGSAFGVLA